LLQRFAEVIRALAQLVEEPGILDRDDGLRGKILYQLDLLVGKWPNLLAEDANRAE